MSKSTFEDCHALNRTVTETADNSWCFFPPRINTINSWGTFRTIPDSVYLWPKWEVHLAPFWRNLKGSWHEWLKARQERFFFPQRMRSFLTEERLAQKKHIWKDLGGLVSHYWPLQGNAVTLRLNHRLGRCGRLEVLARILNHISI